MTQVAVTPTTLAARYLQCLDTSLPFSRGADGAGDLYLVPPEPSASLDDHHLAMRSLVSQGALSDYRYIDSKPQAVILAIRSRS